MHHPDGFTSGNVLLRPFGVVNWCIVEMEGEPSKRLAMLPVPEVPFDVRQNRCTKEVRIVPLCVR
jgi:hypothetical protein